MGIKIEHRKFYLYRILVVISYLLIFIDAKYVKGPFIIYLFLSLFSSDKYLFIISILTVCLLLLILFDSSVLTKNSLLFFYLIGGFILIINFHYWYIHFEKEVGKVFIFTFILFASIYSLLFYKVFTYKDSSVWDTLANN